MENNSSCCFTGYRPHKFGFEFSENSEEYVKLENKLVDAVFSLPEQNCFTFYCGMAMGFDILAGEIVALLKNTYKAAKIELVAVIPFEKQSEKFDKEWKKRYDRLLKKTDRIIYVSREYHKGCFAARNKYMVDNVNHPAHYNTGKIEVINYINDKLNYEEFTGYLTGNIIKYISRYKHKNGLEDLKKAQWYLNYLINYMEAKETKEC